MRLPPHGHRRTASGVALVAAHWPDAPYAELRVHVPATRRTTQDAVEAQLLGRLLALAPDDAGASAQEDRLLRAGGVLRSAGAAERVSVSATLPTSGAATAVGDLVARVLAPRWRPSAVDEAVAAESVRLAGTAGHREVTLQRELTARRWGDRHPYARGVPGPDDLAAGTAAARAALVDGTSDVLRLPGTTVVVVGDLGPAGVGGTLQALERALEQVLEQAVGGAPPPAVAVPPPAPTPGSVLLRPVDGDPRASYRLWAPAPPREHPDHAAALGLTTCLGGYFASRLVTELRERRGDVYGVGAGFEVLPGGATFVLSLDCDPSRLDPVAAVVRETLDDLLTTGPTADELAAATAYTANAATVGIATPSALASAGAAVVHGGDDLGVWDRHADAARRLGPADVARTGAAWLAVEQRVELLATPGRASSGVPPRD